MKCLRSCPRSMLRIMPFTRMYFGLAILLAPLLPWAWKAAACHAWLTRCYLRPCNLAHHIPAAAAPADMAFLGAPPP